MFALNYDMCLRCAALGLGKVLREIKCRDSAKSVTDRREIRASDIYFVANSLVL